MKNLIIVLIPALLLIISGCAGSPHWVAHLPDEKLTQLPHKKVKSAYLWYACWPTCYDPQSLERLRGEVIRRGLWEEIKSEGERCWDVQWEEKRRAWKEMCETHNFAWSDTTWQETRESFKKKYGWQWTEKGLEDLHHDRNALVQYIKYCELLQVKRQQLVARFQEAYPDNWKQKLLEYDLEQERIAQKSAMQLELMRQKILGDYTIKMLEMLHKHYQQKYDIHYHYIYPY